MALTFLGYDTALKLVSLLSLDLYSYDFSDDNDIR